MLVSAVSEIMPIDALMYLSTVARSKGPDGAAAAGPAVVSGSYPEATDRQPGITDERGVPPRRRSHVEYSAACISSGVAIHVCLMAAPAWLLNWVERLYLRVTDLQ